MYDKLTTLWTFVCPQILEWMVVHNWCQSPPFNNLLFISQTLWCDNFLHPIICLNPVISQILWLTLEALYSNITLWPVPATIIVGSSLNQRCFSHTNISGSLQLYEYSAYCIRSSKFMIACINIKLFPAHCIIRMAPVSLELSSS